MNNEITYEVENANQMTPDGTPYRVIRRVQPGGEFILEPGERLVRAWSGEEETAKKHPEVDGDAAMLHRALDQILTMDVAEGVAAQIAMDGSAPLTLLMNHWNVPGYPLDHEPEGPFGFIKWQLGPTAEPGGRINGTTIEDVTEVLIARLTGFNAGPFRCRENSLAITAFEEARNWLLQRRRAREVQGVAGKNLPHIS